MSDVGSFCKESCFEASSIFIEDLKTIIATVTHQMKENELEFLSTLQRFLVFITRQCCYNFIIGGNLNINID